MIKEKLRAALEEATQRAIQAGKLGALTSCPVPILIEKPRLAEHGDLSCGVALKLASTVKTSPIRIAETIAEHVDIGERFVSRFEVAAPGFINFHLGTAWLNEALSEIHRLADSFGKSQLGNRQRVLIEYVSANPTGELHIGHGRGAVYGSCLAHLLRFAGFKVEEEFYVNDTGEQIAQLGRCAWALYQRRLGKAVDYPAEGYPEESLVDFVDLVIKRHGEGLLNLGGKHGEDKLGDLTKQIILESQRDLLLKLGVQFDRWFSELSLHENGRVEAVLERFARAEMSYEADGALWLKTKELGDERDRVLRKSGGNTTYLAADAAYHEDKFARGYDRLITIWGADHHGQVPGLKAAVRALGYDPDRLEVILNQIVNLSRDGQSVRMSKRMGTVVTLAEVMDEVGKDAVRYYLAESNPQNPINFDLELAKQTSRENPAFYIQYAHARCCAIMRKALEPAVNLESGQEESPPVDSETWQDFQKAYREQPELFQQIFERDQQVFAHQKELILHLQGLPEEVEEAAVTRAPGRLARYAYELANHLQKFYEVCRVITSDKEVTRARLGLIVATRQVLANVLGIIGVTAPERM